MRRPRPLVVPHRRLPQLRDDAHRRHRRLRSRPSRAPRRRQRAHLLLTTARRRGAGPVSSSVIRRLRGLAMARAAEGQLGTDARSVSRDTMRLVAFSDGVFAITITLLVLEIRPPTDDENLLHGLAALWPSYLSYAVTFLIGQVWANHHVMFDHIRAADRTLLLLNTVLLMVVAFLPFATSVLADALRSGHGQRTAVAFYGIAFGVTALTFNAVWQYACRRRLLSRALDPMG